MCCTCTYSLIHDASLTLIRFTLFTPYVWDHFHFCFVFPKYHNYRRFDSPLTFMRALSLHSFLPRHQCSWSCALILILFEAQAYAHNSHSPKWVGSYIFYELFVHVYARRVFIFFYVFTVLSFHRLLFKNSTSSFRVFYFVCLFFCCCCCWFIPLFCSFIYMIMDIRLYVHTIALFLSVLNVCAITFIVVGGFGRPVKSYIWLVELILWTCSAWITSAVLTPPDPE